MNRSTRMRGARKLPTPRRWGGILFVVAVFFTVSFTWAAGITVPEKVEPYKLIVATLDAQIPDGAQVQGGWKADTLDFREVPGEQKTIIAVGPPGKHDIYFRGVWLKTTPIEINGQTVQVLEGFGFLDSSATVTVEGQDPDPPQPDPPGPDQKWQIMMFYDGDRLDNLPQAQRNILTSLKFRQDLVAKGNVVLEILERKVFDQPQSGVPDSYRPYVDLARDKQLPYVVIAPKEGGKLYGNSLPESTEAFWKMLQDPRVLAIVRRVREVTD